ncbi:MAG: polymerase, sigma subunit, family [Acidobacteriaceae bacterium]|nr:polymerase, sigma subunit, family [Acidobacteriaceae bacterium]
MPETNKARRVPGHMNGVDYLPSVSVVAENRPTRVDDTGLIRAAQQGDAAAFEQLVQQYDRAVLRLAIHLTGSQEDAQDIYQEAFLRAYVHLARFRFECSFYTWIYRIVTNLCLDHLRKKRSRGRELTITISDGEEQDLLDHMPDQSAGASPERNLASRILRERIVGALARLSPRERMIFELKHYHGLQLRTVAGILNTTEGTVKNTLFRATQKLRLQLSEVGTQHL